MAMTQHAQIDEEDPGSSHPQGESEGVKRQRPRLDAQDTEFRGALEYADPEQRESERKERERWERKRASRMQMGEGGGDYSSWNPVKWFNAADSPTSGNEQRASGTWFDWGDSSKKDKGKEKERQDSQQPEEPPAEGEDGQHEETQDPEKEKERKAAALVASKMQPGATYTPQPPHKAPLHLKRSQSLPHMRRPASSRPNAPRWQRLRSLLPSIVPPRTPGPSVVTPHNVNITDELMAGGLSTIMLKLWFERDEKGQRRVPVLLHRLRIRISDSLYPLSGHKAVFRIECEYANGASRWVIYRQLRDFISLHTHYTASNAWNRNVEGMPDFPTTSLPYFKWLRANARERGADVDRSEFARMQRGLLEDYLLGLIRAVMFHPTSNRLCGFLEISALSIQLAPTGGTQYKAGFLRIDASGSKGGGFGRRSASWAKRKEAKWCAVRESYLVAVEEQGEATVWDVFLFDQEFKIERPPRAYRQGLNILTGHPEGGYDHEYGYADDEGKEKPANGTARSQVKHKHHSVTGSIRRGFKKVERALHIGHQGHPRHRSDSQMNGHANARSSQQDGDGSSSSSSNSSDEDSDEEREHRHMLDPSTNTNPLNSPGPEHDGDLGLIQGQAQAGANGDATAGPAAAGKKDGAGGEDKKATKAVKKKRSSRDASKHTFYIENAQMRLKLIARNERQMQQWIAAMERVAKTSHYTGMNRFKSFAPIRLNVAAQWLVDGRDYFWNLARAILLARDRIYIHDWWLSPELQLRRPSKEHYRLDKLLQRKAQEGVKVYVILYQEVSSRTTPTDSNYAKQRLTSLHENIMVQRSPSHFQTGTFYWAHHEKMCVIDDAIAFMGGLDLCFGRWDTAQHVLVDDLEPGSDGSEHVWPGKDYSNPRVKDFYSLNQPDEDMYDRQKIPRMPWHDVGMQIVGQPARDLARHFVQRWNYLLRIKNHSRTMPFLLPPPEFHPDELTRLGLTGTLEFQICRSAGPWSLGTPTKMEHSIQDAYLKAIQMSEHFVYIENQFFITSTMVGDVKIENKIGDALVHRIIRAHREGVQWKACILIPLIPGFTFPVDHNDASAIRIILECQNRTISRGPNSIYGRLRKEGIDPDDYISVFCLRNWGKLKGDVLTTEQVYIHGKVCIVDDRLVIMGSANINERSMRGDRDSELAAVIRDTDMIDGTMAGKPFKVGRFAHTLRVRLMREHLGVDVDAMYEEDLMANEPVQPEHEQEEWDPDKQQQYGHEDEVVEVTSGQHRTAAKSIAHDVFEGAGEAWRGGADAGSKDARLLLHRFHLKGGNLDATAGDQALKDERTTFTKEGEQEPGFASAQVPTLEEKIIATHSPLKDADVETANGNANTIEGRTADETELYGAPADAAKNDAAPPSGDKDVSSQEQTALHSRSVLRKHVTAKLKQGPWTIPTPRPQVDPNGFDDPVCDAFWRDVWVASAVRNTEIFRKVFHAIPDDMVTTWKQYKEFIAHHERLNKPVKGEAQPLVARMPSETADGDAPGHQTVAEKNEDPEGNIVVNEDSGKQPGHGQPQDGVSRKSSSTHSEPSASHGDKDKGVDRTKEKAHPAEHSKHPSVSQPSQQQGQTEAPGETKEKARRHAKGDEPFEKWEREEMENLLHELNGQLVLYPTRFLEGEDIANNFLFNADRLLPLPIYD
ncbi:phospholipase D [Punctularia strigosozonata HHB-11173 SS5]|uniref:phospholipase D n=1 Tax=Punctularia strigosozonata (strain HHB-11173) TaxID=741275 RepID=UPI0004418096|nr:phospholipase D [Punctularia strigosozonata HHB-11173 SS5]EIN12579.1 phospholipase D [Punctularia strigosozonata HHB-11173 SS5]